MKKSYQEPSLVSTLIEPNISILGVSPGNLNVDPDPIPEGGEGS